MKGGAFFSKLLVFGGVMVAAACADTSREGPTSIPSDAMLAATPSACDFTALRRDARSYLSSTDPILDILRALQDATRAGNTPLAFNEGMNALARMSAARNAGISNAPATGAKLALGILSCIGATQAPPLSPLPTLVELENALRTDANGGIFQVLGGTNDPQGAVEAVSADPRWGAEPDATTKWAAAGGVRYLLYAFRIDDFSAFTNEDPAGGTGTAFELRTIPTAALTNKPLVGVCVTNVDNYRVQWKQTILALEDLQFCATDRASSGGRQSGLFATARRALGWFAPKPLHASAFLALGTGGRPSGFTPFGAVDVVAADIRLVIDPIADGNRNTLVPIRVTATSADGHPVDNVLIVLSVAGNNGLGSDGQYELLNVQTPTDNGGVATFLVDIDKAGGFLVRADGYFNAGPPDLPTLFAISNRFNLGG